MKTCNSLQSAHLQFVIDSTVVDTWRYVLFSIVYCVVFPWCVACFFPGVLCAFSLVCYTLFFIVCCVLFLLACYVLLSSLVCYVLFSVLCCLLISPLTVLGLRAHRSYSPEKQTTDAWLSCEPCKLEKNICTAQRRPSCGTQSSVTISRCRWVRACGRLKDASPSWLATACSVTLYVVLRITLPARKTFEWVVSEAFDICIF